MENTHIVISANKLLSCQRKKGYLWTGRWRERKKYLSPVNAQSIKMKRVYNYCIQRCDIYAPTLSICNQSIPIHINLSIDCYWKSIPIDNHNNLCHRLIINYQYQSIKMSRKSTKRFGNLKRAAKVENENSCSLWTTNSFTCLLKCETCKFVRTNHYVPPLWFCMCNPNLVRTKTCLVLFVKPFLSFKLKSVLYSYCLTERNSHLCALPWFLSEEIIL